MDYVYIRAWCKFMHHSAGWLEEELELAWQEDAPSTAIYKYRGAGLWRTVGDITRAETLQQVEELAEGIRHGVGD